MKNCNAWEWEQDGWDSTFYAEFTDKPAINPASPFLPGSLRVLRGGEWLGGESLCRTSDRNARAPQDTFHVAGFRVALSLDAVRQALKVTGVPTPKPTESNAATTTPAGPVDLDAERRVAE